MRCFRTIFVQRNSTNTQIYVNLWSRNRIREIHFKWYEHIQRRLTDAPDRQGELIKISDAKGRARSENTL